MAKAVRTPAHNSRHVGTPDDDTRHGDTRHGDAPPDDTTALWELLSLFSLTTGLAFLLYAVTAAPGITWAHHGADGGELIAAAMTNGVPHPPGYPLYTLLLRGWLWLVALIVPGSELAWRGNMLSALLGSLSVGVTGLVAYAVVPVRRMRWPLAFLVALAWTVSPLMWSQAIITEVYALHALTIALLGLAVFVYPRRPWLLMPIAMLGVANHLTILLLLPAALYLSWTHTTPDPRKRLSPFLAVALGLAAGALFYVRTPLVAGALPPPPVNWGYADNAAGFWWLVSGQAYRSYLFNVPGDQVLGRVAGWANTLVSQLTPVGLGIALVGFAYWDQTAPTRRNFALLWILPVSLYSIVYYTRDSDIYLLPVSWLITILFGVGLAVIGEWVAEKLRRTETLSTAALAGLAAVGLLGLMLWRFPNVSLRTDAEARQYLQETTAVLEADSIVITGRDFETFALWYGAWGSGTLLEAAPDAVLVNYALYQFDWYGRLMGALYPDVAGIDQSVQALLSANAETRPIYFSEQFDFVPKETLSATGALWRYQPTAQ